MVTEILFILVLSLLNGVFAGAEMAFANVRRTRLNELIEEGRWGATDAAHLKEEPDRFLAIVQIVVTLISVLSGVFAGASLPDEVEPFIAAIPGLAPYAPKISTVFITATVVTLQIVLGELVPKSLALRYAETYMLLVARPLRMLAAGARPVVWFLTSLSNLVLRPFGDRTSFSEGRYSVEELIQYVDEAATVGNLDPSAGEIASRAMEFDNLDASSLMVPRPDVQIIAKNASLSEVAMIARDSGHARVPVYDGDRDNLIGFINVREILAHGHGQTDFRLERYIHPVPFIAETMPAPAVLRELQRKRSHLALVVDEQGQVRGLVSMEDLLEELVGEIYSENDKPEEIVRIQPDGTALVLGNAAVHEVARALEIELPEGDTFSTMAGLAIDLAGRIPDQGSVLHTEDGVTLEILEATPRRIRLIRLRRAPSPAVADEPT